MLKRFLSLMLVAAVVSQGIARAEERAHPTGVSVVEDRAALLAHIEGRVEGHAIVLAIDDGVASGEFVEEDADGLVMDRPLLQGEAARIAIPRQEIQAFRYQPGIVPQATPIPWKTVAVLAAIVAAGGLLTSVLVSKSSRR